MTSLNHKSATDVSNTTTNPLSTTTATSTTGKKKFGKNLNKLTKPPAPPAASESKANAASRNGLLLLSTNKRNSTTEGSGGLLASKPTAPTAPLPSLGLQYMNESSTSTHDVLLGAVVGAAASRAEQTPDAWGVAAQAANHSNASPAVHVAAEPTKEPTTQNQNEPSSYSSSPPPRDNNNNDDHHERAVLPSSNWDEYGGRGDPAVTATATNGRGLVDTDGHNHNNNVGDDVDSQQVYMAKLARERAERRRQEEAARAREQNEKAAQRLRDLESKLVVDDGRNVVLEPLGGAANNNRTPSRPVQQRTLFDPNQSTKKSYSALVGGAAGSGTNGVHHDGKNHSSNGNNSGASVGSRDDQRSQGRGNNGDLSPRAAGTPGAYNGPVIHLNSYEDRDRGEAPRATAAPRMLFDPKSGSMVAVTSRDDNPRGGGGGAKNASGKVRGGRNRGGKQVDDENGNNARGSNNKKDKGKIGKKSKPTGKNNAQKASKSNTPNSDRKLPRTRGVLYARDDKGNCYCADGCDGDLGYGAHSVPGGRVRNPDAYDKFVEQQQQMYKEQVSPSADANHQRSLSNDGYDAYHDHHHHGYNPYEATEDIGMGSYDAMYAMPPEEEEEETQPQLEWVKPTDKIELLTGVDEESPTLRVNAREWAPSQAALAAAAQVAGMPTLGHDVEDEDERSTSGLQPSLEPRDPSSASKSKVFNISHVSDDEDEDEDVTSFIGLPFGFGPSEMTQSPPDKVDGTNQLNGVDFGALSLDPPICGMAANNHNNIFAFGSSTAWGTGGDSNAWGTGGGGSNDWGSSMLPGSSNAGTIATSRLFGGVLDSCSGSSIGGDDHEDDAFLSLATGIPGFLAGGAEDNSLPGEHKLVGGD